MAKSEISKKAIKVIQEVDKMVGNIARDATKVMKAIEEMKKAEDDENSDKADK